jgi:hypothetical protein
LSKSGTPKQSSIDHKDVHCRLRTPLHGLLIDAAHANSLSLSAEISRRLEASVTAEPIEQVIKDLVRAAGRVQRRLEAVE